MAAWLFVTRPGARTVQVVPVTPATATVDSDLLAGLPIIKWVGGKHRLLEAITANYTGQARIVEPFFGGGAVTFALAASGTDHDVHDAQERLAERYGALVGFVMTERGLGSLSAFIDDVLRQPEAVPAEGRSLWGFFAPAFVDLDGELSGPTPDDFGCPRGVGVEDWFLGRLKQLLSQIYRDNPGLLSICEAAHQIQGELPNASGVPPNR